MNIVNPSMLHINLVPKTNSDTPVMTTKLIFKTKSTLPGVVSDKELVKSIQLVIVNYNQVIIVEDA